MSLGRTKCDLSVFSDLKTVRMPCCSRQRLRGSDTPCTAGSFLGAVLALVIFCTKEKNNNFMTFFQTTINKRNEKDNGNWITKQVI